MSFQERASESKMFSITRGYVIGRVLWPDILFNRALGTQANHIKDVTTKASLDQLEAMGDEISTLANKGFLSNGHPWHLYTNNVIFQDNIRNVRTQGLTQYAMQISILNTYYTLCHTSYKMELLSLVKLPEESCVKVRWRIITRPGFVQLIASIYGKLEQKETWRDGISTIYVNKEGLIYCHVCDNVEDDMSELKLKKTIKNPLVDRGLTVE